MDASSFSVLNVTVLFLSGDTVINDLGVVQEHWFITILQNDKKQTNKETNKPTYTSGPGWNTVNFDFSFVTFQWSVICLYFLSFSSNFD